MPRQDIDLVSAGHICLDITPQFPPATAGRQLEKLLRPGSLVVMGGPAISTGGACANVGLCAQRMGLKVALMGKCGDDLLGKTLLEVLRTVSPDCASGMRIAPGEQTSYTVILAVPGSDRVFLHCPGANDTFTAADIDAALVRHARLFYFGYPPLMARMYGEGGLELARLLSGVRAAGVTTALDMALPDPAGAAGQADWLAILRAALPHVDLFMPSVEELIFMLRRDRYDALTGEGDILHKLSVKLLRELADECLALGPAVVMIKCGYHGLYVRSAGGGRIGAMGSARPQAAGWADKELFAPSYKVPKVVSATGSGDAAVAGFLAGLLRGADLKTAADYGCASGAQNVQVVDAVSGIRPWAETTAQLGNPRIELARELRIS
jgi:sugar/nucleoside kinase (ribokinase family)